MKNTLVSALVMMVFTLGFIGAAQATPVNNLISNGDFEQGTYASPFPDWTTDGSVRLGNALYHPELAGMDGKFALLGQGTSSGNSILGQTFSIPELTDSIHLSFNWALSYYDMSCNLNDSLFVLYQNVTPEAQVMVRSISYGDLVANTAGGCGPFGGKSGIYNGDFSVIGSTTGALQFTLQQAGAEQFGFGSFGCWLDMTNSIAGIDNVCATATGQTAPVPEPATLLLLGSGLLGLAGIYRKRG